ncbi:hypothetical protein SNE510_06590 [Streptomyces sp. NE5-10]|nr:hypothetical protein SNE510_06590 [Streptomyces sp. NE5-10]
MRRYRKTSRWNRVRGQGLRYALPQIDALHHRQFEETVGDLMLARAALRRSGSVAPATTAPR